MIRLYIKCYMSTLHLNFTFKNNRMKIALKRGLIELTQSIESWIVTNGYHSGIIFIIILQEYN